MFAMPSTTPYDLQFRALGIPVRVHPMFWLVTAILGGLGSRGRTVQDVLIWVVCAFVSILVHEYGHGLMSRAFGYYPTIALYWMGGLCSSDGKQQSPGQRLAVLFAGPGAGILFAILVFVLGVAFQGPQPWSSAASEIYKDLILINGIWSLVNLLPIYPLDGGQIAGVLLTLISRRHGMQWTHVLSLLLAGIGAVAAYRFLGSIYIAFLCASLAFSNYQILQAMHQYSRYGGYEDDADYWKR